MVKVIGVTGGIGSGKTTVCKWFETQSVPVYYADDQAKWLIENDTKLVEHIKQVFGEDVYEDNKLNRSKLAGIVFKDKTKLDILNSLVHPVVFTHFEEWKKKNKHFPFVLKEAALMYESKSYLQTDCMIMVYAPISVRILRVCNRDKTTQESVLSRMEKQLSDDEKMNKAHYIIYNDGIHELPPQLTQVELWIRGII
jgi:dephospho-CoA kinase